MVLPGSMYSRFSKVGKISNDSFGLVEPRVTESSGLSALRTTGEVTFGVLTVNAAALPMRQRAMIWLNIFIFPQISYEYLDARVGKALLLFDAL